MNRILVLMLVTLLAALPVALAEEHERGSALSTAGPSTKRAPGQLTTLFAATGGYAGNMFDIEPHIGLTEITALDINWSAAGEVVEVEIYYKAGTCAGYDTDPSAWTLLSTGTGTSAGLDLPTYIDIVGNGVSFDAGEMYGIYVHVENYPALTGYLGYTNAPIPQIYSNTDLSATCYYGKAHPAFSASFLYRTWNGTIHYDTVPPPALRVFPEVLDPWLGGTSYFVLNGGPGLAGRMYGLFGTASGTLPGTPLPGGLTLPINWDWLTDMTFNLAMMGAPYTVDFIGTLDADGHAEATIWLPGHIPMFDEILSNFAWCSASPFDFVSNPVELLFDPWTGG